jgi:hypothetical protein
VPLERDPSGGAIPRSWEVDWDEEDEGPIHRRRVVRVVGLVVAGSLLLGTVGTTVALLLEGPSNRVFSTSVNSVSPSHIDGLPKSGMASTTAHEHVTFTIVNKLHAPGVAACLVTISKDGQEVGSSPLRSNGALAVGRQLRGWVDVAIKGPSFVGRPSDARMLCLATTGSDSGFSDGS